MKKTILFFLTISVLSITNTVEAQEPFLGEIRLVAFPFAPQGWAECNGQLLSIDQNQALFALPDLRGRVPVGQGTGPGLQSVTQGEKGGVNSNILTVNQLPAHNHAINAVTADGNQSTPGGHLPAGTKLLDREYSDATSTTTMNSNMVSNTGNSQAVNNMQPYLGLRYVIALTGIFPSQN